MTNCYLSPSKKKQERWSSQCPLWFFYKGLKSAAHSRRAVKSGGGKSGCGTHSIGELCRLAQQFFPKTWREGDRKGGITSHPAACKHWVGDGSHWLTLTLFPTKISVALPPVHRQPTNCAYIVVCVRWWGPRTPLRLFSTFTDSVLQRSARKKKITSATSKGGSVAPGGCQWPCGAVTSWRHVDRLTDVRSPCACVPF